MRYSETKIQNQRKKYEKKESKQSRHNKKEDCNEKAVKNNTHTQILKDFYEKMYVCLIYYFMAND